MLGEIDQLPWVLHLEHCSLVITHMPVTQGAEMKIEFVRTLRTRCSERFLLVKNANGVGGLDIHHRLDGTAASTLIIFKDSIIPLAPTRRKKPRYELGEPYPSTGVLIKNFALNSSPTVENLCSNLGECLLVTMPFA